MLSIVTINLVVHNGEKYIRHALKSIKEQTYPDIEINIFDNASTDRNRDIAIEEIAKLKIENCKLISHPRNLGMWPGQEKALEYSHGKYIVAMSVDIILNKDFVKNAVAVMEGNPMIGAIEPKILQYRLENDSPVFTKIIDTLGFQIFKSRRITNIAHGEEDRGQYDVPEAKEIFAVEGAVPVLRKEALEDIRIDGHFVDHDYFWYGDDLDFAWRMRLSGWKEVLATGVVAYHDRSTTKSANTQSRWWSYLSRVSQRKRIPIRKRRLDWRNVRFTIVKNDDIINVLKDIHRILWREIEVLGYALLFEPQVLLEVPIFLYNLPRLLIKRRKVQRKSKLSSQEIRKWFI